MSHRCGQVRHCTKLLRSALNWISGPYVLFGIMYICRYGPQMLMRNCLVRMIAANVSVALMRKSCTDRS